MKKKLLLALLFTGSMQALFASGDPFNGSARSLALGSCGLTLSDPYSVLGNQAAMAFVSQTSFALFAEQRYFLKELGYYSGGITMPVKNGALGLAVNYNGFDLYNEKKAGLAYARKFSKQVSGGLQFDYLSTQISEYGTATVFTAELGVLVKITDRLSTAAHVFNPYPIQSGFDDEKIPTVFEVGLSYAAGENVLLLTEAEKDIDYPARFKAGIEYRIIEALDLRGGVETNPVTYSLGAGIHVNDLRIDLAACYHQILGVTPALSLNYSFGKK